MNVTYLHFRKYGAIGLPTIRAATHEESKVFEWANKHDLEFMPIFCNGNPFDNNGMAEGFAIFYQPSIKNDPFAFNEVKPIKDTDRVKMLIYIEGGIAHYIKLLGWNGAIPEIYVVDKDDEETGIEPQKEAIELLNNPEAIQLDL